MARSLPATQVADDRLGLVVALAAPNADGDSVTSDATHAVVANGSGASINVTLLNPRTLYGDDVADRIIAVAAGATRHIPLPASFRQDVGATDLGVDVSNMVLINYSAVASVTRGIARL